MPGVIPVVGLVSVVLAVVYLLKRKVSGKTALPAIPFSFQYLIFLSPLGYYITLKDEADTSHSKTTPVEFQDAKIVPVAIRDDNYAYLIIDKLNKVAAAVDPAEPKLVLKALAAEKDVKLIAILTTHKHWDHSAGNSRLLQEFPDLKVYGSALDQVPSGNQKVHDNDIIRIGSLTVRGLESRVHTRGHILYLLERPATNEPPALFSGDAVFVGGAGKFFESSAKDMLLLVQRLRSLNPRTLLFPGHEYALPNLTFAETLDRSNLDLKAKLGFARARKAAGIAAIPSTLEEEFGYNPFFRFDTTPIRENLPPPFLPKGTSEEEGAHYLSEIRKSKDAFSMPVNSSLE